MLIHVVSRGGNLALNVGPQPNGELPEGALRELRGLGVWLRANGEAIYGTRPAEIPQIDNIFFTQKGNVRYALCPMQEEDVLTGTMKIPTDRKITSIPLRLTESADDHYKKQGFAPANPCFFTAIY